jgi:aconitate decarboxylase
MNAAATIDETGSLTARFAGHLLALWEKGLDTAALQATRELALDGLAVAALGTKEPGPRILAGSAIDAGGSPVATLIGHAEKVSGPEAARANGAAMHVLDYEPMWNPANHAMSTTLPAVLALAEMLGAGHPGVSGAAPDGRAVLTAFALGIETQARLRLSSQQFEPATLQFHPPGAVGPIGSAVACGLLLGLDVTRLAHAIGIAASRAGGLQINAGSMTKALHCGGAACSGIESALWAARGFTADADALAGPRGYGQAFFGPGFAPEWLTKPIEPLHVVEPGPAYKFYPSQYGTHFVITAALDGRAKLAPGAAIERVRIVTPAMPYVDRPVPATGLAGKFSFQYVAAAALLDGTVNVGSFTDQRRFARDLCDLLARVEFVTDPAREGRFDRMRVDVEVESSAGPVTGSCDGPPGIWGRRAGPERIAAKARDCLGAVFDAARTESIIGMAGRLDALGGQGVRSLMGALGGPGTGPVAPAGGH